MSMIGKIPCERNSEENAVCLTLSVRCLVNVFRGAHLRCHFHVSRSLSLFPSPPPLPTSLPTSLRPSLPLFFLFLAPTLVSLPRSLPPSSRSVLFAVSLFPPHPFSFPAPASQVDSMLGQRSRAGEHEAMRKIKNEFMAHWDGLGSSGSHSVLILAATNRPFDLDDAIIRRFQRRWVDG